MRLVTVHGLSGTRFWSRSLDKIAIGSYLGLFLQFMSAKNHV